VARHVDGGQGHRLGREVASSLRQKETHPLRSGRGGEDPILAIGPAIANAVYNAIGVRFREIPITPEKMLDGFRWSEDKNNNQQSTINEKRNT
jgi:hypothetical protein